MSEKIFATLTLVTHHKDGGLTSTHFELSEKQFTLLMAAIVPTVQAEAARQRQAQGAQS